METQPAVYRHLVVGKTPLHTPLLYPRENQQQVVIRSYFTGWRHPGGGVRGDVQALWVEGRDGPQNPLRAFEMYKRLLQEQFKRRSDACVQSFCQDNRLVRSDEGIFPEVTLVTVCVTPICAVSRVESGFDLYCEYYQIPHEGFVSGEGFHVYSEEGILPQEEPFSESRVSRL